MDDLTLARRTAAAAILMIALVIGAIWILTPNRIPSPPDDDPAEVMFKEAQWCERAGHYSDGFARYALAVQARPHDSRSMLGMARCTINTEDQVYWASRAIAADGSIAMAYFLRGAALVHLRRFDEARSDLARAVVLDPSLSEEIDDCLRKIQEE